uniref:Uncharacterized protein n=2 Tax=Musa TaxID=4640 RepID=A0A804IQ90_MUSAM
MDLLMVATIGSG